MTVREKTEPTAMLVATNLEVAYENGDKRPAVDRVSLSLRAGESIGIIGPSGSGKSSLLRALQLLQLPRSGSIHLHGRPAVQGGRLTIAPTEYRKTVGMVHQELFLWPNRTVLGNLALAPECVLGLSSADALNRSREYCDMVGIARELWGRYPHELSGGQRQRVAIARCLAMRPEIILLDEITSGLDVQSVDRVAQVLERVRAAGQGLIIVTHLLAFARRICDRTAVLIDGRVAEFGATSDVLDRPSSSGAKEFLRTVRSVA